MSQFFASGGQRLEFQICINPSKEYSGLLSFRKDLLDLLAVQGTLKNLLQHHSSEEFHGLYSPGGRKELYMTKLLETIFSA